MDLSTVTALQTPVVTPSATRLTADFNTFLTLLTAQLQNQDPLDPLDTDKFVSQLVEFSSVEQSIQTNQNLEALIALQSSTQTSNALALLGETAVFAGDRAIVQNGSAVWRYEVPDGASTVALTVRDAGGRIVATAQGNAAAGEHEFIWAGDGVEAGGLEGGVYRLSVAAVDRAGGNLTASVRSIAEIVSITALTGNPRLTTTLGDIALADVTGVIANR